MLQTTLGEVLMTLKRNEEARAAFNQALEAGTPDVLARRLGDLERRAGRLEAATKRYQGAQGEGEYDRGSQRSWDGAARSRAL